MLIEVVISSLNSLSGRIIAQDHGIGRRPIHQEGRHLRVNRWFARWRLGRW